MKKVGNLICSIRYSHNRLFFSERVLYVDFDSIFTWGSLILLMSVLLYTIYLYAVCSHSLYTSYCMLSVMHSTHSIQSVLFGNKNVPVRMFNTSTEAACIVYFHSKVKRSRYIVLVHTITKSTACSTELNQVKKSVQMVD